MLGFGCGVIGIFIVDLLPRNQLITLGTCLVSSCLIVEAAVVANFPVGPGQNNSAMQAAVAMTFCYMVPIQSLPTVTMMTDFGVSGICTALPRRGPMGLLYGALPKSSPWERSGLLVGGLSRGRPLVARSRPNSIQVSFGPQLLASFILTTFSGTSAGSFTSALSSCLVYLPSTVSSFSQILEG